MNYTSQYFEEAIQILRQLDQGSVERTLDLVLDVRRQGGRIFFLGVGGGAGHASHAVNDFRKIAGIECYAPTDNANGLRISPTGSKGRYIEVLATMPVIASTGAMLVVGHEAPVNFRP